MIDALYRTRMGVIKWFLWIRNSSFLGWIFVVLETSRVLMWKYKPKRLKDCLNSIKKSFRITVGILTGHCGLNYHLRNLKIFAARNYSQVIRLPAYYSKVYDRKKSLRMLDFYGTCARKILRISSGVSTLYVMQDIGVRHAPLHSCLGLATWGGETHKKTI